MTQRLAGLNILLVEDEAVIALDVGSLLGRHNCTVLGPHSKIMTALDAIKGTDRIDCAILDINLGKEHTLALADELRAMMVPYIWMTGCEPDVLPEHHRDQPFVRKPFLTGDLLNALDAVLGRVD